LPLPTSLLAAPSTPSASFTAAPPTDGSLAPSQPQPQRRADALTREAVANLGLPLWPDPPGAGEELVLLAEGGEARLYVCAVGKEEDEEGEEVVVRKAYHKQAMGKALKELQALLAVGAHLPLPSSSSSASSPSSSSSSSSSCCCPALVRLRGVEWPLESPRPTALLLERAHTDLSTHLLTQATAEEQQQQQQGQQQAGRWRLRRPLPLSQVLRLAIALAAAVARLHAAGLCHKDIHRYVLTIELPLGVLFVCV
jgi:hypothetical protein